MTDELIERLEKLDGPCRECDALLSIAFKVNSIGGHSGNIIWKNFDQWEVTADGRVYAIHGGVNRGKKGIWLEAPKWTFSIDAAITLIPESFNFSFDKLRDICLVSVAARLSKTAYASENKFLPIAICISALKARQSQTNQNGE